MEMVNYQTSDRARIAIVIKTNGFKLGTQIFIISKYT